MTYISNVRAYFCLSLLLFSGCATNRSKQAEPLSSRELSDFFGRAQDPRSFWITVYETEDGPRFAGAHRLHTGKFAERSFESRRKSDAPLISVFFRGQNEQLALLDTSSRASWMTYELAIATGMIALGPPAYRLYPTHVNDPIPGYLSVASRLSLGDLHIENALLYVKAAKGNLHSLMRDRDRVRAPVVLGADFIRAFYYVQIDFPNRVVRFSSTEAYTPNPDRLIATAPLREINASIAVSGLLNGEETPFLLDSVGDFELALPVEKPTTVRQIILGDLVLRHLTATPSSALDLGMPAIPRIGIKALNKFIVTFDAHEKNIYFERPQ